MEDGLGKGRRCCVQNGCRRFLCSCIHIVYLYLGTIDETLLFCIVLLWTGLPTKRMRLFKDQEGRGVARAWKTLNRTIFSLYLFSLFKFFFLRTDMDDILNESGRTDERPNTIERRICGHRWQPIIWMSATGLSTKSYKD